VLLELGGSNANTNLWPEPHHTAGGPPDFGSFVKDRVENAAHASVCSYRMRLRDDDAPGAFHLRRGPLRLPHHAGIALEGVRGARLLLRKARPALPRGLAASMLITPRVAPARTPALALDEEPPGT
jgi:hypothetical protein